jgi:hypothetical protein
LEYRGTAQGKAGEDQSENRNFEPVRMIGHTEPLSPRASVNVAELARMHQADLKKAWVSS